MRKYREIFIIILLLIGNVWALTETPDPLVPETNGIVYAIVQHGNMVYVGGSFTSIGGVARNKLAAFSAITGQIDQNWDPNITGDHVRSLSIYDDILYVGGYFNTVNGSISRNSLAAFELADGNNTGIVDGAWNPELDSFEPIYYIYGVITIETDGSYLYVGGDFTKANSTIDRKNLAAFEMANGSNTGLVDSSWNPNIE